MGHNKKYISKMVKELLEKYPYKGTGLRVETLELLLECLLRTKGVEGDVLEMGCADGETSIYLERIIQAVMPRKKLHLYDSFRGLPEPSEYDGEHFKKGQMRCKKEDVIKRFERIPEIHEGWFEEQEYPDKISFAFLDGDFYESILVSLQKVYPRLSKGGIITIHDYTKDTLPGVEKACKDFFAKESMYYENGGRITIFKLHNLAIYENHNNSI